MPGHHHRAGALKQSNKKNKRSKSSKRSLARSAGGKVANGKSGSTSLLERQIQQSKTDRRHRQEQIRRNKRDEILRKRRGITAASTTTHASGAITGGPPARVVGIIALGVNVSSDASLHLEERLRHFLAQGSDHQVRTHDGNEQATWTVKHNVHKKDGLLTLLTCQTAFASHYQESSDTKEDNDDGASVLAALDLARIADLLVFVVDGNGPILPHGSKHFVDDDPILDMQIGMGGDARSTTTGGGRTTTTSGSTKWDHLISDRGDRILTALKAQGLPTILTVLAHTQPDALQTMEQQQHEMNDHDQMTFQSVKSVRRSSVKRRLDLKKYVSRFATTEFGSGNDKVVEVDLSSFSSSQSQVGTMEEDIPAVNRVQDTSTALTTSALSSPASFIRTVCSMSCSPSKWVANSPRTYLLSDCFEYNEASKELSIKGYLRGIAPMDVHSLLHIPCLGTFAPVSISKQEPPIVLQRRQKHKKSNIATDVSMEDQSNNILVADAEQQDSLNMFATPDALTGEQNLIGFDDEDMEEKDEEEDGPISRPAGWSDYQSAWLDAVEDEDEAEAKDRGELAEELNLKKTDASVGMNDIDLEDANDISQTERQSLIEQRKKEQTEHEEFPDEVQVGEDDKACERFARYRSLKSFKKSIWDPKESLPESYATVYHISSFKATQRTVMNDMKETIRAADSTLGNFFGKSPREPTDEDEHMVSENSDEESFDPLEGCVPSGTYVKVTLGGIAKESMSRVSPKSLLTAVALLEHENKVSVLHMGLCQTAKMASNLEDGDGDENESVPIKSKDTLTFRCGWRTWQARPIFSQNNLNCNKHKFERFLPTGGAYFAASVFGPVTYTPCPVLVFRDGRQIQQQDDGQGGRVDLVVAGTMMNADADRIVVKRIVLTGYPVRVHKRHATVKYMFYNPDDVKWFKPAELHTKHGLRGNIIQSVGEHGTMKCLFNAPIKQHDTVCLPLYKRVYPKYYVEDKNPTDGTTTESKTSLVVR